MYLTLDKHFMKFYENDKLYIKLFKKYFFQAFNTIVYIRIITLSLIFRDLHLVEYLLCCIINIFFQIS